MHVYIEFLATLSCLLFAGAALYINLVEHPARMGCETRIAATVWAPSYKLATVMQASLAIVSCVFGCVAYLMTGGWLLIAGALLIGAVIPFTFIVIMPVNNRLLAPGRDLGSNETRDLLVRWGHLHAVRTALSIAASLLYLAAFGPLPLM